MDDNKASTWLVYIIQTVSGKLYTGITTDLDRRYRQHAGEIKGGAKFFRSDRVKSIVYQEQCKDRSDATKREIAIKRLARNKKMEIVKNYAKIERP